MGTRSLTHVKGDVWEIEGPDGTTHSEPPTLVTIYRQMDGYPSGMGEDLAKFLKGARITNGIVLGDTSPGVPFNGMGELAAHLVRVLKEDSPSGGIYIEPPDSEDLGEAYVYTISNLAGLNGSAVNFKVETVTGGYGGKPKLRVALYDGPAEGFSAKAAKVAEDEFALTGNVTVVRVPHPFAGTDD